METQNLFSKGSNIRTPQQMRIIQRLNRLVGPGPALFYEDACWLMSHESHIPSTTHLVSHILREIESALLSVLAPLSKYLRNGEKEKKTSHRDQILGILTALEIPADDPISKAWLKLAGFGVQKGLDTRAHRNNLNPPRPIDEEFLNFWFDMGVVLEKILDCFEAKYLLVLDNIERLRQKENPNKEDASYLKNKIPNNFVAYNSFFFDLDNPSWLEPLYREGLFSSPTEPIENKQEGIISFPQWPQSRYLLAMAPHEPELVSEIIRTIDTKNVSILADLLDAICQFPSFLAVKHVDQVCQWEFNVPFLFGQKIGNLVTLLSQGNEISAAVLLSKKILSLHPIDTKKDLVEKPESFNFTEEPRPVVDKWEYQEFLLRNFKDLYQVAPREAILLVIDVLDDALPYYPHDIGDSKLDYSEIWRPAIEENPVNHGYQDPRYELVTAIRNSVDYYIDKDPNNLNDILCVLAEKSWSVFTRLAVYFVRVHSGIHNELARSFVMNKSLFMNIHTHHEYVVLVKEFFSNLDESNRKKFLSWINKGPRLQKDEENPEKIKEWWQLQWLTILKGQLPPSWEKRRQSLLIGKSEPEDPEFIFRIGEVLSGPTSPLSVEQLKVLSVDDIVAYLKEWTAPTGFSMDSPEGVSRILATVVSADPERFANDAEKFIGCDPTYVHGIFSGLQKALEAELLFSWPPVFKLMLWVICQEREISEGEERLSRGQDPDWGWTRTIIAGLLEKGFSSQKNQIPYSEELSVWKVLHPLTDDPNPTDSEDSETGMGPAMQSINNTRGTAFHALVAYALWKKRNILINKTNNEVEICLKKNMPEVLTVLEKHLDPIYDSSPSIRAVYGWHFPKLAYVDHKWAMDNKDRIFPKNIEDRQYRDAAWSSYVGFNRASKDLLQDLYAEYLYSVSSLLTSPMKIEMGNNPNERLVEHLIQYFAWNDTELDSELMINFWGNSPPELRSYAIRFIGKAETTLPANVLFRLKQLWEARAQFIYTRETKEPFIDELRAFGWIFVSESFDEEWALNQLEQVLEIVGETDYDHGVVKRLALLSENHAYQSVKLVSKMIGGGELSYRSILWNDNLKIILSNALSCQEMEANKEAVDLINRLAALGHSGYKDLLVS